MTLRMLVGALAPAGRRSRLSVLIFHRVLPLPDPLLPTAPDAAAFETQMRWVNDWFNVLPLSEAVAGLRQGTLPARSLCVTFDDGYADNVTVALPILKKLGMHATFFIATGFLNGGRMWNDSVIEAVRGAKSDGLDLSSCGLGVMSVATLEEKREAIRKLLPALKYLPQRERDEVANDIARSAMAPLPADLMLTDAQVRDLDAAGMTIGAHTVTHPILAQLPEEKAVEEIRDSGRYLESLLDKPITLFAYPNGRPNTDYTLANVLQARDAGFEAAVSTAPGSAGFGTDMMQIPRFTPWDRERVRYGLRLTRNLAQRQTEYASHLAHASAIRRQTVAAADYRR